MGQFAPAAKAVVRPSGSRDNALAVASRLGGSRGPTLTLREKEIKFLGVLSYVHSTDIIARLCGLRSAAKPRGWLDDRVRFAASGDEEP
jgi:hypothetical protein